MSERDPVLTQLATEVRDAQEHRKQVQAVEIEAKEKLKTAMLAKRITEYVDDEADVSVKLKTYESRLWVKTKQQEHDAKTGKKRKSA